MRYGDCANCGYPVEEDYVMCPNCHQRLKNLCPTCTMRLTLLGQFALIAQRLLVEVNIKLHMRYLSGFAIRFR